MAPEFEKCLRHSATLLQRAFPRVSAGRSGLRIYRLWYIRSAMSPADLALELRARRLRAGWTQTDLARAIGSTQPAVARVESGGVIPSLPFVDRWVAATGYPLTLTLGENPKTLTSQQKGQLVRDVLGADAFDPWQRLEEKRARGMNVEPERRYLMSTLRPRRKAKTGSSRD